MTPEQIETRKRRAKASRKRMAARGIKTHREREKQNHPSSKDFQKGTQ